MKRLVMVVCVLLCTVGSATFAEAGPSCPVRKKAVQLTEKDAGRTVRVSCGTPIVVTAQNYTARSALSSASSVVRVGTIDTAGPMFGGTDTFHFATLRPGQATLHIHRGLPFALPTPLPEPFDFDITVQVNR